MGNNSGKQLNYRPTTTAPPCGEIKKIKERKLMGFGEKNIQNVHKGLRFGGENTVRH